jgi:hypothetical protein
LAGSKKLLQPNQFEFCFAPFGQMTLLVKCFSVK